MYLTGVPMDKKYRLFKPTDDHERNVPTNKSVVKPDEWMMHHVKWDKSIPDQTNTGIRRSVFQLLGQDRERHDTNMNLGDRGEQSKDPIVALHPCFV